MKQIFINLPVQDIEKSMLFYNQIGFTNEPLFSGNNQKCVVWSEHIFVMLQSKEFFRAGNTKTIADLKNTITVSHTLPLENIQQLNKIMENALKAGGTEQNSALNEGFMQVRILEDIDGHIWGLIYLDIEKFKIQKETK